jgi:hypothetical protein
MRFTNPKVSVRATQLYHCSTKTALLRWNNWASWVPWTLLYNRLHTGFGPWAMACWPLVKMVSNYLNNICLQYISVLHVFCLVPDPLDILPLSSEGEGDLHGSITVSWLNSTYQEAEGQVCILLPSSVWYQHRLGMSLSPKVTGLGWWPLTKLYPGSQSPASILVSSCWRAGGMLMAPDVNPK